jgi:hypothetical protein
MQLSDRRRPGPPELGDLGRVTSPASNSTFADRLSCSNRASDVSVRRAPAQKREHHPAQARRAT